MKNAYNLDLLPQLKEALEHLGFKAGDIFEMEPDAALGNGGLGRLRTLTCPVPYPAISMS